MRAPARGSAAGAPLRDFYENPAVPASSGPDRAREPKIGYIILIARSFHAQIHD